MTYSTDILGVSATASQDEIRSAYRKQARLYHPDSFDPDQIDGKVPEDFDANDLFIDIQNARDALINAKRNVSFNYDWENGEPVFTQSHDEHEENVTGTGDQQKDSSSDEEHDVHGGSNEAGGSNKEKTDSSHDQHGTSHEDTEDEDGTDDENPWDSDSTDDGDIGDTVGVNIDDEDKDKQTDSTEDEDKDEQTVSTNGVEETVSVNDNSEGGVITTRRAILTAGLGIGLYTLGGQIPSSDGNEDSSRTQLNDHVVVDPSESINEAIERVDSGGILELSPGTYQQNIIIERDISLVAPDGATLLGDEVDETGIDVVNANVNIQGLTIVDFSSRAIDADSDGHEIVIQDVTVDGISSYGISVTADDIVLEDVSVLDTRREGIQLYSNPNGSISISNIELIDNGRSSIGADYHGLRIEGGESVTIDGGEIINSEDDGIRIKAVPTPDTQDIDIKNLFIGDAGSRGIRIEGGRGSDNVVFNSVEVHDSNSRAISVGNENSVETIRMENVVTSGHRAFGIGAYLSRTGTLEIVNSEIHDVERGGRSREGNGVKISGAEEISFDNVRFTDTGTEAIRIDPENVEGQRIVLQDVVTSEESLSDDLDIDESRGGNTVMIN